VCLFDTEKERDTAARRQIRTEDPERRSQEQERDTIGIFVKRYDKVFNGNTTAHRVATILHTERQRDLQHHQEARSDPEYRTSEQMTNNMRRQQVRHSRDASFRALNYEPDTFHNTTGIGTISSNCGALKFDKETDGLCCSKGKVQLDQFPQPHHFLQHLYEGIDSNSKHFLANIRKYNSVFQMTSFGCNEVSMAGFNPSFRIQGQVYHLIGSIVPTQGESHKYFL